MTPRVSEISRPTSARRAWRLSTQIFIGLSVLLALVLVLELSGYRRALEDRRRAEVENATAIGRVLSSVVDAFASDLETTTLAMAAALGHRAEPLSQERDAAYVRTVLGAYPTLRALFITDTAGRVIVAREDKDVGTDLSSRPYVKALRAGAPMVWSDLLLGIQSGTVTVAHGRVIGSPAGRPKGYVIAAFFPERVFEDLPVPLAEDARITLLDRRGQLLFTSLKGTLPATARDFSDRPEIQRALAGEVVVLSQRRGLSSGEARFGVIVPIPRTGWIVSFTRPVSVLQTGLRAQFTQQGAQLALILLVLGGVATTFVIRLTRPLSDLAASAAAVARGERRAMPSSPAGLLEVRQLAEGMEVMSRAVAEREDTLRKMLSIRERLYRLGETVARSDSLEEIYQEALDTLRDTLGAERSAILLYDEEGVMRFIAWRGLSEEYRRTTEGHSPWPPDERDPQPVLVADAPADPTLAALHPILTAEGIRGIAFIPLVHQHRLMGKCMAYYPDTHTLSPQEVYLAQIIAANVAFAIQRRRHEERLAAAEASEHRARVSAETAADRLQLALAAGNMGTWEWELSSGRVRWSESLEAIHGLAPGTFGGTFDDFLREIHPGDRPNVQSVLTEALERGNPYEVEYRILLADGRIRWLGARGRVLRDASGKPVGMTGVCADVTARRTQEEERTRLLAQEQAARADAEGARGRLAFLAEASVLLSSSLDQATILRQLARLTVPRLADWASVYTVERDGTVQRVEIAHSDPVLEDRVRSMTNRYPPDMSGPQTEGMRAGRTLLIPDITEEVLAALTPHEEMRALMRELAVRSLMAVPLIARGQLVALMVFAASGSRFFGPEDVSLAEELARRAAVAVDNARLYQQERTVAHTLQQAFLPATLPQVPGVLMHAAYLPGTAGTEIGGDWYDAFWLPDGRLGVSIGDVTGHGVEAAVVMGQVRQGIRAAAWDDPSPSGVLTRCSRLLHLMPGEEMATALYGVLDPAKRTFTYASAGHPAPILAAAGEVKTLPGGGLPLGMRRALQLQNESVQLPPGGLLVLFTDGLIEFERNPLEGERLLLEAVRAEAAQPSSDRALALQERVLGSRRPPDDVAVITLSVTPVPLERTEMTVPAIPSALPLVRQAVRHATEAAGLPLDRATGLVIAACEAVNNAIEHAYGIMPGDLTVRAEVQGDALVVTVQDRGRWRPPRADGGGRGMILMRTLADRADVVRSEEGTTVRLEARLAPAGARTLGEQA